MSYPRNNASPERIAVGAVVQISDGAVQTSGVSISVRGQGGASGAGGGTTAYDNGIVQYTPTQGETDFTSFVIVAYKTGCIPASVTVVTSAAAVPGKVDVGAISGDATAADNAEAFFDGTGYAGTNNVIPTVTNVTNDPLVSTSGTATAGGPSTITLAVGTAGGDDYYVRQAVMLTGGTGAGQTNRITAYNSGTRVATVADAWVTQPDNTTTYKVLGRTE